MLQSRKSAALGAVSFLQGRDGESHRPGHAGDFMLRNVNTGALEIYDFAGNQLTAAVSRRSAVFPRRSSTA
jgi:hypothetical protein